MKTWRSLPLAIGVFASVTTATLMVTRPDARSVGPVRPSSVTTTTFSRAESTGLFVGVRTFRHDQTLEVPYAADDAVDLAHRFSLDQRSSLIPPSRVVLALSGRPQKEESKRRLRELQSAGARVEDATSGDILSLLKERTAAAGSNGLFVLSLATHGFVDSDGDAYILGATSAIGSPETSLPAAMLLDLAGRTTRSLVFVDACRDRLGTGSRSAASDPTTAAPMISKMGRIRGQAIFYAAAPGQYAFDDKVHQNGVFTRAVLEGLACKASAPRGEVVAETLRTYVEREVRRWIRDNDKGPGHPSTQVSLEGGTGNMPLAQCWRSPRFRIRVAVDGSTITAYDTETRPLWRKDLHQPITRAEAADLDADAFYEVIVGAGDAITVFDRDGRALWKRTANGLPLTTFTTGDLFRKHTSQIVSVWTDGRTSRLIVLDSAGNELSRYDHDGVLQHVAVGRPTNMHAPKIAVSGPSTVFLLDPKKVSGGKPLWSHALLVPTETINALSILDANNDSRRDIEVSTRSGLTLFAFDGQILRQSTAWQDVPKQKAEGPRR